MHPQTDRHLGIFGATSLGVGAIVGGGILALAGAAFAATGFSATVAFGLNGLIALMTALSFAEVCSKFPESGGTYNFAKKVLSVEAAFAAGWVVWFASIVAAVLYALGFAKFATIAAAEVWVATGHDVPGWLDQRPAICALAAAATLFYALSLIRKSAGGGQWINIAKVAVFAVLILGGIWALRERSASEVLNLPDGFFAFGAGGLFQAMGFTFMALQGFDLIAAVAGEVREPERTVPRAMLYSLGLALLIYLPMLFVVGTVGLPTGESIVAASRANPEAIVALAARNYLGTTGYWLVIVAALLSMLSALQANLYAASRVVMSMARDRTMPRLLSQLSSKRGTPAAAIALTSLIVIAVTVALPNVAAAGAASSLIFLITFALAHWIAVLVRMRSAHKPPPFRSPLFPLIPVVGGLSCLSLAVYQGVTVASAGVITAVWLCLGGLLFLSLFARSARIVDASHAAFDPELTALRGRNPLVLVPIANPSHAAGLVTVAGALAPPRGGRVLMLSVVVAPADWKPEEHPQPLQGAQSVLFEAISASVAGGLVPESLTTVARQPWNEIIRVAKSYRCESMVLGLSALADETAAPAVEQLVGLAECDLIVLGAPKGWQLGQVENVLVPTGGRGGHEHLLARLLSSMSRSATRKVTLFSVLPTNAPGTIRHQRQQTLQQMANDMFVSNPQISVAESDTPVETIVKRANESDLVVLGAQRLGRRKFLGQFALQVARKTSTPVVILCRR